MRPVSRDPFDVCFPMAVSPGSNPASLAPEVAVESEVTAVIDKIYQPVTRQSLKALDLVHGAPAISYSEVMRALPEDQIIKLRIRTASSVNPRRVES